MKDGYYLSTYLEIDPLGSIYHLSQRHDCNVSLWYKNKNNINLVRYWELERLSGQKEFRGAFKNVAQAKKFLNWLLSEFGLQLEDINDIIGTPGLDTRDDYYEHNEQLSYHSICHLFSSLMMDTEIANKETIIGLAVDAGPDVIVQSNMKGVNYYTGAVVRKGQIELFPASSPAMLWLIASIHYGLKEGSLMALASASSSKSLEKFPDLLVPQLDGNAATMLEYFEELVSRIEAYGETDTGVKFTEYDPSFSKKDNYISMVMKEVQRVSQNMISWNIEKIIEEYHIDTRQAYFAISGGYALNCPCNSYIMKKYGFKGFLAPPVVNDSGMSLGIALYFFWLKAKGFNFKLGNAYYGCASNNLEQVLKHKEFSSYIETAQPFDTELFIEDINSNPVVWFNGHAEIGPRALGNRSLIATATSMYMKDKLNEIKQRQWWRPVAPIVLEEALPQWFEEAFPSPYMLLTFKIKNERQACIPAVSHLDCSARVQSIGEKENPLLHKALSQYYNKTGVPLVCNTSLNDRGEPIINTIEEALNFALRKNIAVVYINGTRLQLKNHVKYTETQPRKREQLVHTVSKKEKDEILSAFNPFSVPEDLLGGYYMMPELYSEYDLTNKKSARAFVLHCRSINNRVKGI